MEKSSSKVAFAPRADIAQRVEDAKVIPIGQLIPSAHLPQLGSLAEQSSSKVGIVHEYGKPGRPKKHPELNLPKGFHALRKGRSDYSDEYAEEFIDAYYHTGGSVTRACRQTNTRFAAFRLWMQERPEFARAIQEVDQILQDEIHSQFMTRVLNEWEPNPAWKFKYFNKHFPEYSETKKQLRVSFQLKDTLIRPAEIIEGEVVRKEISDGTGSQQSVETTPNTR